MAKGIRLEVRLEQDDHDAWEFVSRELGFPSIAAWLRVMAKPEVAKFFKNHPGAATAFAKFKREKQ